VKFRIEKIDATPFGIIRFLLIVHLLGSFALVWLDMHILQAIAFIATAGFLFVFLLADYVYIRLAPEVDLKSMPEFFPLEWLFPSFILLILVLAIPALAEALTATAILAVGAIALPLAYSWAEGADPLPHCWRVLQLIGKTIHFWFGYPRVTVTGVYSPSPPFIRKLLYAISTMPLASYLTYQCSFFAFYDQLGYMVPISIVCYLLLLPMILIAITFPAFSKLQRFLERHQAEVSNVWQQMVQRTVRD
jgi:hypothetical protein